MSGRQVNPAGTREPVCSCCRCGCSLGSTTYRFGTPTGYVEKCGRCALLHPPLVRSALRTAALVGTILTLINQADTLFGGHVGIAVVVKIGLTYIVPYAVSTHGALSVSRVRADA